MTDQTKVLGELIQLATGRTLEERLADIIPAANHGASASASVSVNTAAINAAIVSANGVGFVLVAPGVSFTESSLVIPDGVVILIFGSNGTLTFLVKDQGASPIAKGGIIIKSQDHTGILLRAIDQGLSTEPMVQLVDPVTGDIAAANLKFTEFDEITDPTAPSANKARLYTKDDGSGNTQLMVRFPTGSPMSIRTQGNTQYLQGTATYDPANLVDGAGVTTTVTVTGAVLGDLTVASFSLDLQGITLTSYVSAADTVSVRFQNESGGAIDLASGTIKVRVIRDY